MQPGIDWYERAEVALNLKQFKLALQLAVEGLATRPDCDRLLALAAEIQYSRRAYTEACEFARQAIGKNAEASAGYFWLAHALLRLPASSRDRAELLRATERVLEICPEHSSSHLLAGHVAWTEFSNLADAERSYRRALELDPENNITLHSLGCVIRHRGRSAESRELLEKLLSLHPNDGDGLRELAWLHLDLDDPQAALQFAFAARETLPLDIETYDVISRAAFQLKEFDLALQAVRDLQHMDPGNSRVWTFGAEVLTACGRYQEAHAFARRAIALDPTNWDAHTWLVKAMNLLIENRGDHFGSYREFNDGLDSCPTNNPINTPHRVCLGSCLALILQPVKSV
jgi:tetratricopeptide (TPR) repeat protein